MNRLKNLALTGGLMLLLLGSACTGKGGFYDDDDIQLSALPGPAQELLARINETRTGGCRCGADEAPAVPALKWNEQLAKAARRHVSDMASNRLYSHTGSDGSTIGMRAREAGYQWALVGENIAHGLISPREVVLAWINSPSHCKTLMAPEFTEMGLATQEGYWVQTLGLPGK